jgi:hypothetical protein
MNSLVKTDNLTPEEEYRAKLLRVFELALLLNPTETEQGITGSKPTVFVDFSGHVSMAYMWIHKNGWKEEEIADDYFYLPVNNRENLEAEKAIEILENLLSEWGD